MVKGNDTEARLLRIKAKELFEVKGLSQKQIAEIIKVSEKTISEWKTKNAWYRSSQRLSEQKKAKQLIVILGYNQKETAIMVGVSEKTVGVWAIKYKWQAEREVYLKKESSVSSFVDGFCLFIELNYKPFSEGISSLMEYYHHEVFLKKQNVLK